MSRDHPIGNADDPDPPDLVAHSNRIGELLNPALCAIDPECRSFLSDIARAVATLPHWPQDYYPTKTGGLALADQLVGWFRHNTCVGADKLVDSVTLAITEAGAEGDRYRWYAVVSNNFDSLLVNEFKEACSVRLDDAPALVAGLINHGQPMVIGGAEKSMKTSLSIDMAAALATGTPFLGRDVPKPVAVAAITLETTRSEWLRKFRLAVQARGIDVIKAEPMVTVIGDGRHLKSDRDPFRTFLRNSSTAVVILDPAYLILPTERTTDLVAVGRALRQLCQPITDAGATPIVVHHMTKSAGRSPTLGDLSGAGFAAWARSWLLVGRQDEYRGGNVHNLLASLGTSQGDFAELRVRIDERDGKITTRPGYADDMKAEPAGKKTKAARPQFLPSGGA